MKQITFRCSYCKRICHRNPRVRNQRYCGNRSCQQARKTKWQREKQQSDPDYRITKKESQQLWKQKNPDYWKEYRRRHPEYRNRNNQMQQRRDRRRGDTFPRSDLAKMDTLDLILNDTTRSYYICPAGNNLAKMDALAVKIVPITAG